MINKRSVEDLLEENKTNKNYIRELESKIGILKREVKNREDIIEVMKIRLEQNNYLLIEALEKIKKVKNGE